MSKALCASNPDSTYSAILRAYNNAKPLKLSRTTTSHSHINPNLSSQLCPSSLFTCLISILVACLREGWKELEQYNNLSRSQDQHLIFNPQNTQSPKHARTIPRLANTSITFHLLKSDWSDFIIHRTCLARVIASPWPYPSRSAALSRASSAWSRTK